MDAYLKLEIEIKYFTSFGKFVAQALTKQSESHQAVANLLKFSLYAYKT